MCEDLRNEINALKQQMAELQGIVKHMAKGKPFIEPQHVIEKDDANNDHHAMGVVYYAGQYETNEQLLRWEPQQKQIEQLLHIGTDKLAKILSALGSKPRLDIITTLLLKPLTGSEIVDKLNMGTTGQLYHHLKALLGADLLVQDKSGRYTMPNHRKLPFLLLISAVGDMLDTSDYLDMVEVRNSAGTYLGDAINAQDSFDAHVLLWAVVEHSIVEHIAGFVTEVHLFLHQDGSITVSDNGRGIPVTALQHSHKSNVQKVLTEIKNISYDVPYQVTGAEKGISISVVNALTYSLSVEIQRDGYIYRQDYKHGIPQSDLKTVGVSQASGTSMTFKPDPELFRSGFNKNLIKEHVERTSLSYPNLSIHLHE